MMIKGLEGMSPQDVHAELQRGGKFVVFQYVISVVLMTFRRSSDVYYVRAGESALGKGLPYTLLSLVFGWWGIPWGFIYTPLCLATNLGGGKDVTEQVLPFLLAPRSDPSLGY